MKTLIKKSGSPKLAFLGMGMLAIGAMLSYDNPMSTPIWALVLPMAFLAVNLLCAILTYPRINRRGGLLTFHVGLLALVVLAAIGRLTFFEAHVELRDGQVFTADEVIDVKQGPWHKNGLTNVSFMQGSYTVDYFSNLRRGPTRSYLLVKEGDEWQQHIAGDDTPLVVDGYRFYTSYNKGFAPVLTWMSNSGEAETGAIHMPSYPLYEYKQDKEWVTPGGDKLRLWLSLETGLSHDKEWILDTRRSSGQLVVTTENGQRYEIAPGDEISLPSGQLRFEELSTWMGYKIFYDPTLHGMFFFSILSVLGLFAHFWRKMKLAQESTKAASEQEVAGGLVGPYNAAGRS